MLTEQRLISVMACLAERYQSFDNEARFRDRLMEEIKRSWPECSVRHEQPFPCERLTNENGVLVDLVVEVGGKKFGIELKYVEQGTDMPGQLPYASHWDCAKIETLMQSGQIDDGVVIALTCEPSYWSQRSTRNWARYFYLPDFGKGQAVSNLTQVVRSPCDHGAAFNSQRFHVLLRDSWEYHWHDYAEGFRYALLLRGAVQAQPNGYDRHADWQSIARNRMRTVPFASRRERDAAMAFAGRYRSVYQQMNPVPVRSGKGKCPICLGVIGLPTGEWPPIAESGTGHFDRICLPAAVAPPSAQHAGRTKAIPQTRSTHRPPMPAAVAAPVDLPPHTCEDERRALHAYWAGVFERLTAQNYQQSAPLLRLINQASKGQDDVRKVHDKFGWAAKDEIKCAGALYRTHAFMTIPPALRDASKPRGVAKADWPRNIHMEHTIPASQLHGMWRANPSKGALPKAWFISNGVTTAMHVDEERRLSGDNRAHNPCFEEGHGLPFQRYRSYFDDLKVFNVVTGEWIGLDTYKMSDHRATVETLLRHVGAPQVWIDEVHAAAA